MARRRYRQARENPSTRTLLVGGGVLVVLGVGAYYLYKKESAPKQLPPPAPTPSPTPAPAPAPSDAATPQSYQFSTNDSGGHVTLKPRDTISFTFPNDPNAATTVMFDWFWTSAPNLSYMGRTVSTSAAGQLVEVDTFEYGGQPASTMHVDAQLLQSTGPARATSGPTPPTAVSTPGASTFQFTIVTVGG